NWHSLDPQLLRSTVPSGVLGYHGVGIYQTCFQVRPFATELTADGETLNFFAISFCLTPSANNFFISITCSSISLLKCCFEPFTFCASTPIGLQSLSPRSPRSYLACKVPYGIPVNSDSSINVTYLFLYVILILLLLLRDCSLLVTQRQFSGS